MELDQMTTLNDLPDEILVEILDYFTRKELIDFQKVNEKWRHLIDRAIGVLLLTGNGNDNIWSIDDEEGRSKFEPIERVGEIGISECMISEVFSEDVPTFCRPSLVQYLWFDGFISPENFNKLVRPLVNLQILKIHITTLSVLPILDDWLIFPNLKTFMISQLNIDSDDLGTMENLPLLLDNIVSFLQRVRHPILENLKLHLPYTQSREGVMVGAVVNSIGRVKQTLKKLTVAFDVRCHLSGRVPAINFDNNALRGLQLSRYVAHCIQPQRPIMTIFENVLASQQRLRKLHFTTKYIPLPIPMIMRNTVSLVAIEISLTTPAPTEPPIDLTLLGNCNSLKLLSLFGKGKEQEVDENGEILPTSHNPDIIGLNQLKDTVESVRICNLYMTTVDTSHIALNLPKLQILELREIGSNGDLGLEFNTIMSLIGKKLIKTFSCSSSFNSDSLEKALTDGVTNFLVCLMNLQRAGLFTVTLDENNFYRTDDSPKFIFIDEEFDDDCFPVEDILTVFDEEDEVEDDNVDEDDDDNDGDADEDIVEDEDDDNENENDNDNDVDEDEFGENDGGIDDPDDVEDIDILEGEIEESVDKIDPVPSIESSLDILDQPPPPNSLNLAPQVNGNEHCSNVNLKQDEILKNDDSSESAGGDTSRSNDEPK